MRLACASIQKAVRCMGLRAEVQLGRDEGVCIKMVFTENRHPLGRAFRGGGLLKRIQRVGGELEGLRDQGNRH